MITKQNEKKKDLIKILNIVKKESINLLPDILASIPGYGPILGGIATLAISTKTEIDKEKDINKLREELENKILESISTTRQQVYMSGIILYPYPENFIDPEDEKNIKDYLINYNYIDIEDDEFLKSCLDDITSFCEQYKDPIPEWIEEKFEETVLITPNYMIIQFDTDGEPHLRNDSEVIDFIDSLNNLVGKIFVEYTIF